MTNSKKTISEKTGIPAGSMIYVGEERTDLSKVELVVYNNEHAEIIKISNISDIKNFILPNHVNWLRIYGVHDIALMKQIAADFNIDHLLIEDIMNTSQRTKIEVGKNNLLLNLKKLTFNDSDENEDSKTSLESEQISLFMCDDVMISFQESPQNIFQIITNRIMNNQGRIRKLEQDYLYYSLLDNLVDDYFNSIEKIGNEMNELEEDITDDPSEDLLIDIQRNKRDLISLRKTVFPLRESVFKLSRQSNHLLKDKTVKYINDVYDHTIQIMETVESYRDINSGLKDMYLSSLSQKTNEVIQVLTLISTIFIPLTFISGVYGMNFKYLPELEWKYGYHAFWGVTICIFGGLIWFFKKKKWI